MSMFFKCNGPECNVTETNLDNWLVIGSNNNSLFIENNLPKKGNIHIMSHFSDIHFCSKECVVCFFIKEEEEVKV